MFSYISNSLVAALAIANSLDYTQNGNNWDVGLCQTGGNGVSKQSPIDLSTTDTVRNDVITWGYSGFPLSI